MSSTETGMVVTLNDRPNCSRYPDLIDFSSSAFQVFAPTSKGKISGIDAKVIGYRSVSVAKKTFENDVFKYLGIELIRPISNTYFTRENILIE